MVLKLTGYRTSAAAYVNQPWAKYDWTRCPLMGSWSLGRRTQKLRFRLEDDESLGAGVISGIKIKAHLGGMDLEKSYSPTSHPEARGFFDLLVKWYDQRPGGGMGLYLNELKRGESITMRVKPQKFIHDKLLNQWKHIGLLVAGTGVAPAFNVLETLLNDPYDDTKISLLATHSLIGDALLLEDFRKFSQIRERIRHKTTLSRETDDLLRVTSGGIALGRIDHEKVRLYLPPPTEDDTLIIVCGTGQFVDAMAGPVTRVVKDKIDNPDGSTTTIKHKLQGPTLGILGDLGFQPHQVFKL